MVYADIELTNADEIALEKKHVIGGEEIKRFLGGHGCCDSSAEAGTVDKP